MKPSIFLLTSIFVCQVHADTIRMRNGTEQEGEVIAENDDHYVVMIQVTKTIRDQRNIPKSEVLEIVAERKDEMAFEEIKVLVPTPDLLTLEQYEGRTEAVEGFMKEFPESDLLKEADKLLKVLDEERKVVAMGGVKFEGKMIEAGDRAARAYPLDARIAASKVTTNGDAGNITQALRAWSELENDFSTSQAYSETIPYARKMMNSHLGDINQSLATFDKRIQDRDDGLERIDARDRDRSRRAIADQSEAYQAKLAKEKEERLKWPSLDPYHKEPMLTTKRLLETELAKLERFDPATVPNGDQAWNDAWDALSGEADPKAASAALSAARAARLPAEYITILEAKAPKK